MDSFGPSSRFLIRRDSILLMFSRAAISFGLRSIHSSIAFYFCKSEYIVHVEGHKLGGRFDPFCSRTVCPSMIWCPGGGALSEIILNFVFPVHSCPIGRLSFSDPSQMPRISLSSRWSLLVVVILSTSIRPHGIGGTSGHSSGANSRSLVSI